MHLLSKFNECNTFTNSFQKILYESGHKPSKIWVAKGIESYNRSVKSWLEKNNTQMCWTQNEGKYVVAEGFIGTLKIKIDKYTTSIPEKYILIN